MKKNLTFLLAILFGIAVTGQQTEPIYQPTKQDYLRKSKEQKTTAWILLGGGAALTVGGVIVFADNFELFTEQTNGGEALGVIMTVAGGSAMVGSIPLFIASARNKGKSEQMSAALGLKMENSFVISNKGMKNNYYPALSLKINLR